MSDPVDVAVAEANCTPRILLIEDDKALCDEVVAFLSGLGFSVSQADNANRAREILQDMPVDLCLIDIMLPGTSGRVLCGEVAERHGSGVIMISALSDSETVIAMLEMGADDYLVKPFDMGELSARMRAVLRRRHVQSQTARTPVTQIGQWRFDRSKRRLTHHDLGHSITLTSTEAAVLRFLASNRGVTFSREDLLAVARMRQHSGTKDRSVDTMIQRLRQKIEPDPKAPTLIVSVYGKGYRLEL